jgi:hypothetical protein
MLLLTSFKKTLEERIKDKIFVICIIFAIGYFIFQLTLPEIHNYLSTFYFDKISHAAFGYVIGSFGYVFSSHYFKKNSMNLLFAIITVGLIGSLKELFDIYYSHKYFSNSDFAANYIGLLIFYIRKSKK